MFSGINNNSLTPHLSNAAESNFERLDSNAFLDLFCEALNNSESLYSDLKFYPSLINRLTLEISSNKINVSKFLENPNVINALEKINKKQKTTSNDTEIELKLVELAYANENFFNTLFDAVKINQGLRFKIENHEQIFKVKLIGNNTESTRKILNFLSILGKISGKSISVSMKKCKPQEIVLPESVKFFKIFDCNSLKKISVPKSLKKICISSCDDLQEVVQSEHMIEEVEVINCNKLNNRSKIHLFKNLFQKNVSKTLKYMNKRDLFPNLNEVKGNCLQILIEEFGLEFVLKNIDPIFNYFYKLSDNNKNKFLFEFAYILMEKDFNLFLNNIDLFPIREDPSLFEAILKNNKNFHFWEEISNYKINYSRISSEKIEKPLEINEKTSINRIDIRGELISLLKQINYQNDKAPHYIDLNKIKLDGHIIKTYLGYSHCYDIDPEKIYLSAKDGIDTILNESRSLSEDSLKIKKLLLDFIELAKNHSSSTLVSKTFIELMLYFNFYCLDRKISELEDANRVLSSFFHLETQSLDDMIFEWLDFYKEGILNAITLKYSPQFHEIQQLHLRNLIAKIMLKHVGLPKHININVRDVSMTEKFQKKTVKIDGPDAHFWEAQRQRIEVENPQHIDLKRMSKKLSTSFESITDETFLYLKAPFLVNYVMQQINEMLNNPKNFTLVLDLLIQFSNDLIPNEDQENAFFEKVHLGIKRAEAQVSENQIRIAILSRNTTYLNKIKTEHPAKRHLVATLENEYRQIEEINEQNIKPSLEILIKSNDQLIEILEKNDQNELAKIGHDDYQRDQRLKRDRVISDHIEEKGLIIRNSDDSFKITFQGTLFLLHKLKFLSYQTDTTVQPIENVINPEDSRDAKKLIDFFYQHPKGALSILNSLLLDDFNFSVVEKNYNLNSDILSWLKEPKSPSQIKKLLRHPAFFKELIKNIKSDFSGHLTDMINLFAFARNECNEHIYNELLFVVGQKNSDLLLDECFFVKDNWSLIKSYSSNRPLIWENFISQEVNHSKLSCIMKKKDESIFSFETDFKLLREMFSNVFSDEKIMDFASTPSKALASVKREILAERSTVTLNENLRRKKLGLPLLEEDKSKIEVCDIKAIIYSKFEKLVVLSTINNAQGVYYNDKLQKITKYISEHNEKSEIFKQILELIMIFDRYCNDGKKESLDLVVKILNPDLNRTDDDIYNIDKLIYQWMDDYKFGVIETIAVNFSKKIVQNMALEVHFANHIAHCMRKFFLPPDCYRSEEVDYFYARYIEKVDDRHDFWDGFLNQEILSHFISPLMTAYVKNRVNNMIKRNPEKADLALDILKEIAENKLVQKINKLNEDIDSQAYKKGIQAIEKRNLENKIRCAILQDNQLEIANYKKNGQFQQIFQEIKRIELEDNEDFTDSTSSQDEENIDETKRLTKRKGDFNPNEEPSSKRQKTKGDEFSQRGIKRKGESDIDDGLYTKRRKIEEKIQKKIELDTILLQDPLVHKKEISEVGISDARSAIWLEKDQLITDFLEEENLIKGELWDNTFEITLEGVNMILQHLKYLIKK